MTSDPEIPLSPEEIPLSPQASRDSRAADVQITDPAGLLPVPAKSLSFIQPPFVPESSLGPRRIPHLGHVAIFGVLILAGVLLMAALLGTVLGLHLFGKSSIDQLAKSALLIIPIMALGYIAIAALAFPVFGVIWQRPFTVGIHLNYATARRLSWWLLGTGIGIGMAVQFLSNYLPIPKSLPIDDFFKTTSSVWAVAIFGIFVAPAFEELTFRGFLLPGIANTWDWLIHRARSLPDTRAGNGWSPSATLIATVLTSIAFMMIHADQLAHAWAPLAVLFTVSVLLCAVRIVTGSLAASILVHASYNFSIFATLFLATDGFRHLEKMHS